MPIRNRWKVGDYLMRDDESGRVHYRSEMVRRWDGLFVRKDQYETRQPQEFVHAYADPAALQDVRPDTPQAAVDMFNQTVVGNTSVPIPRGPAWHLYNAGIGTWVIETTFVVQ